MAKSITKHCTEGDITYQALIFVCPGCIELESGRGSGLHLVPVNTKLKKPAWKWNKDREAPTLTPSLRTNNIRGVCHLKLRDGRIEYLKDSNHSYAGKTLDLSDVPEWIINEKGDI